MKYAILSDIHGNLPALEKVLEDAKDIGSISGADAETCPAQAF